MAVAMFGLKACSTCAKAIKWMDEHGVAHTFSDYRDNPIAPGTLKDWAGQLGGWEKLVNRASLTWRNLPAERKTPSSDEEWLALIAEFPALVKRPVTMDGAGRVAVGFSDKAFSARFGQS